MHREMLVAMQVRRFARLEELGRDADAPFRRGSNLFELTWQARERERGGESGSKKEMSHHRWTLPDPFLSSHFGSSKMNHRPTAFRQSRPKLRWLRVRTAR